MKCKRCGFDNPDYLEYCQNCTAPLDKKDEGEGEPSWGFVKAPKWAKPEFSADTVSDSDVPADYVASGKAAAGSAAAAAAAAASDKRNAKQAADRIEEAVTEAPREALDRELDELDDEFDDDFDDDLEEDYDDAGRKVRHGSGFGLLNRFKKNKRTYDDYDDSEDDFDDEQTEDIDELDDYEDFDEDDYGSYKSGRGGRDLSKLIKILGLVAALAVLAVVIWLIARSASNCSRREPDQQQEGPTYNYETEIEQSVDNPDLYYVTVYAPKGTQLVYETAKGDRYPTEVPDAGYAKFRVPVLALMPNEPVEGSTYNATPRVLVIEEDGSETPVEFADTIPLEIPSLGVTYDNESSDITSADGKVTISGHITYINAELTMNGEPVEIASDGVFKNEYLFEEPGDYTVTVEAKLANYSIERRTFNIKVEETAVTNPDAFIQMPWDYGDTSFAQRVVFTRESIDVRGKVPEGSSVSASCASSNATLTTPTVDADGTFHFTVTMKNAGDYVITLTCTTAQGNKFERDIHVQRQPDYNPYKNEAVAADYAGFSRGDGTKYRIEGEITEILKDGDYYLAKFKMTDGNTIIIEYHPHYGSGRDLHVGDTFTKVYGRSWGPYAQGEEYAGTIRFYVWFIDD